MELTTAVQQLSVIKLTAMTVLFSSIWLRCTFFYVSYYFPTALTCWSSPLHVPDLFVRVILSCWRKHTMTVLTSSVYPFKCFDYVLIPHFLCALHSFCYRNIHHNLKMLKKEKNLKTTWSVCISTFFLLVSAFENKANMTYPYTVHVQVTQRSYSQHIRVMVTLSMGRVQVRKT